MVALLLSFCTFLFFLVNARPESTFSTISGSSMSHEVMDAQSPEMSMAPTVKVVHIHHQDLNKRILVALVISCAVLAGVLLLLLYFWIYRRKNSEESNANSKKKLDSGKGNMHGAILNRLGSLRINAGKKSSVAVMEYRLLEAATNNFSESNVLGEGGHGRVYRARLSDKSSAAVKKMDCGGHIVAKEFVNEVKWLSKIHHPNIISLLGYCTNDERRFLVYEIMENGSLESQLHGPKNGSELTWHLRMKVAVDIARGLEYLHEHCNPPVVHRDLKSSNILLDSNFNAKLSDFGLAVNLGAQNKSIKLLGTMGYVAPEYLLDGKLTDKSDVYAFGVVLLELLTGKRAVEKMSSSQFQSIVTWAMPKLTDRSELRDIVDPVIIDTMDLKQLYQVAAVAVLCVQQEPSYRPLITDVLHSLIPLLPQQLGGSLRTAAESATVPTRQHC